ncbi:hypothetical protein AAEX63_13890 [Luteococcus sp. H138]|uniref:hypothetical protein n=1 Tax=unclassified Luteococcus TaxID=2639923 RepID=UPI00313E93A5
MRSHAMRALIVAGLAVALLTGCVPVPIRLPSGGGTSAPASTGRAPEATTSAVVPREEEGPVKPYQPSFPTLRYGPDDGKGAPEVDYSNVDQASQRLARDLKRAAFPKHSCRPPVEGPNSFTGVEQRSEAYVNCVLDAWRPWLADHGSVEPTRMELRHCGLAPHFGSKDCAGDDGVTWNTRTGVFYLDDGFDLWGRERGDIAATLNRMVATVLQDQVRPKDGDLVLTMGVSDQRHRQNRRRELQVECMAAGQLNASTDAVARKLVGERSYYDPGEFYWDEASQKYWQQRGRKGVVGECDAMIAAPELVRYHGK